MSRGKTILWLALMAATQVAFFCLLFTTTPKYFALQLVMATPLPIIAIIMAGLNKRRNGVKPLLFVVLCVAITVGEFWGASAMRNQYVSVLRIAEDGTHSTHWSKDHSYNTLDGHTVELETYKEHYYVDNNSSRRIRIYHVKYSYGKMTVNETMGYIEPFSFKDIREEPKFKLREPYSRYNSGDSKPSCTAEDYIGLDFCSE